MRNYFITIFVSAIFLVGCGHDREAVPQPNEIIQANEIQGSESSSNLPRNFSIVHAFQGSDGATPAAALIFDGSGNLYGTTVYGGSSSCRDCGVVFKLDPSGNETVLHKFNGEDGEHPSSDLVFDATGNLYGTTSEGGSTGCYHRLGCGVVFMIDPSGHETVLHRFSGPDGANPFAGVVRDAAGNLYGDTRTGGSSKGEGVVYKIDPNGNESVLLTFHGRNGRTPVADLLLDAAGNLYGTTTLGGPHTPLCGVGCGVVFKIDPSGNESVLHRFDGADGGQPYSALVQDAAGNLYGTTAFGGSRGIAGGTAFELDHRNNYETVLHRFSQKEGAEPLAGLIRPGEGNLYGTSGWGPGHAGTVFALDRFGNETVLHVFHISDGVGPQASLVRDAAGNLYGTATEGGGSRCFQNSGCGVVFKISH
jgi:uncharacterized repeat protein (TIGR03803 family)